MLKFIKETLKAVTPRPIINAKNSLREFIKNITRTTGSLFPQKTPYNINFLIEKKCDIFFGYYDVSPFSNNNRYLLAGRSFIGNQSPDALNYDPPHDVGYFDLENIAKGFQKLEVTYAWNWQQACRLQWLGQNDDKVIYNIYESGKFKARILEFPNGKFIKDIEEPIYSVSSNGKLALNINFSKLHELRKGYGYHQHSEAQGKNNALRIIKLDTSEIADIFSIQEALNLSTDKVMPENVDAHYFNHADFLPGDERIQVFHTFKDSKGRKNNRLITMNLDGTDKFILANDMRPAHYRWINKNNVIITGLNQDGKCQYALYCDKVGLVKVYPGALDEDGHPSMYDNTIISDTYPNLWGIQKIFSYDLASSKKTTLASFYLPLRFSKDLRCDLHPRLSHDGSRICMDIVKENHRAIALINSAK